MTNNKEIVAGDYRLFEMLKQHTIRNAMVIMGNDDEYWEEHEGFNKQEFEEAIVRCCQDNGTDQDWEWLVEETRM